MTNAASERTRKRAEIKAREDLVHTEVTIRQLMGHRSGRRWMWLTLGMGHCFDANLYDDPIAAARFEGERRFGLYLFKQVQRICPREYIQMTTENTGIEVDPNPEQTNDDPE